MKTTPRSSQQAFHGGCASASSVNQQAVHPGMPTPTTRYGSVSHWRYWRRLACWIRYQLKPWYSMMTMLSMTKTSIIQFVTTEIQACQKMTSIDELGCKTADLIANAEDLSQIAMSDEFQNLSTSSRSIHFDRNNESCLTTIDMVFTIKPCTSVQLG